MVEGGRSEAVPRVPVAELRSRRVAEIKALLSRKVSTSTARLHEDKVRGWEVLIPISSGKSGDAYTYAIDLQKFLSDNGVTTTGTNTITQKRGRENVIASYVIGIKL